MDDRAGNILAGIKVASAEEQRSNNKENHNHDDERNLADRKQQVPRRRPTSGTSSASGAGAKQHKLKQRFNVIRKLGKGTYGKVQLAINKETGQEVAIKTIKKTKIENEQDLQRVRREIQIMSSIEHPHIIHIYEVFENKDKIVLIMQYAPGGELYEYVSQSRLLDDSEARRLFRQIATAIYYCHQNKICHRDLKLENILLDEKNNAKIADFGLSNVFDKHRQLKTFCGSPLYASPEIVQGSPYEGPEVDCWSLGVLLYTLVYGAMPFDGSNFKRLVKQISEASYYEPEQRSPASPLISKLLCADPLKRANILDICSDPWVNGLMVASSPRVLQDAMNSLTQPPVHQQAHAPLLKVAQDMADLTPVRLDILLALIPTGTKPSTSTAIISDRGETSGQLVKLTEPTKRQPTMTAALDPTLMEVDQIRATTSPVASYIVRDLSQPMQAADDDDNEVEIGGDEKMSQDGESVPRDLSQTETENQNEDDLDRLTAHMESEMAKQIDGPQTVIREQPQAAEASLEVVIAVDSDVTTAEVSGQMDTESPPAEQAPPDTAPSSVAVEPQASQEVVSASKSEVVMDVEPQRSEEPKRDIADGDKMEAVEEGAPSVAQAETNEQQPQEGPAETKAPGGEERPKKVKKKVVVVKKRKKLVKRDATGGDDQVAAGETTTAEVTNPADGKQPGQDPPPEQQSKASGKGPGKVRIPDTFQTTPSGPTSEDQPRASPAGRRQSALVAGVSQKLLQQQQQKLSGASNSSSAIELDQPQLASVRVSDKLSEFERRASLVASPTPSTGTTSPRGPDDEASANDDKIGTGGLEPRAIESKRERVRTVEVIGQTIVEPVVRQPAQQLEAPERQLPDLPTPTEAEPSPDVARKLAECADRLSAEQKQDERSDSVETIKAEAGVDQQQLDSVSEATQQRPNVRSNLEIKLGPSSSCSSNRSEGQQQAASSSLAPRPAPIARSYKKVTFTKDGTCITETGKVYSTRGTDGTLRRIERKSKVTHYPADSELDPGNRREEMHEEVVYEGGFEASSSSSSAPFQAKRHATGGSRLFERLIMPSSQFLGPEDEELEDLEEAEVARGEQSPFGSQRASHYQSSRADSVSSCSSGSTDVFDDTFDTWTGATSMFNPAARRLADFRSPFMDRAFEQARPGAGRSQVGAFWTGSLAGTPRCESVEPSPFERRHRHQTGGDGGRPRPRHRRGAEASSGYDSDVPLERPQSATLGSARGRTFGSSNLFARAREPAAGRRIGRDPLFELDEQADHFFQPIGPRLGPFAGSLFQDFELEHERLRRKIAQQHRQLWKGSKPSLFADSATRREPREEDPLAEEHQRRVQRQQQQRTVIRQQLRTRSSSGSQWDWPSMAGEEEREAEEERQRSTGGGHLSRQSTRQSTCQSLSGIRQSLPLEASPTRRNTASLADHLPPRQPAVRRSTSKSSILTKQMSSLRLDGSGQRSSSKHHHVASFIELKRTSSSSMQRHLEGPQQVSSGRLVAWEGQPGPASVSTGAEPSGSQQENVDSRIQSWLQQSSGNLSASSGSKSSASDTLASQAEPGQQELGARLGQLPPAPSRSPSNRLPGNSSIASSKGQQSSSSMAIRFSSSSLSSASSSRQLAAGQKRLAEAEASTSSSRVEEEEEEEEVHEKSSKVVAGGGQVEETSSSRRQLSKTSSGAKVSQATFTLRSRSPLPAESHSQQTVGQQQQSSTFVQRSSPSTAPTSGRNIDGLHWANPSAASALESSLFGLDEFGELESLSGSGADLESRSSSSLLDQLRSRGYRSMINQRLSTQPAPISELESKLVTSSASLTGSATHFVTSTSMTMSSSTTRVSGDGRTESQVIRTRKQSSSSSSKERATGEYLASRVSC